MPNYSLANTQHTVTAAKITVDVFQFIWFVFVLMVKVAASKNKSEDNDATPTIQRGPLINFY